MPTETIYKGYNYKESILYSLINERYFSKVVEIFNTNPDIDYGYNQLVQLMITIATRENNLPLFQSLYRLPNIYLHDVIITSVRLGRLNMIKAWLDLIPSINNSAFKSDEYYRELILTDMFKESVLSGALEISDFILTHTPSASKNGKDILISLAMNYEDDVQTRVRGLKYLLALEPPHKIDIRTVFSDVMEPIIFCDNNDGLLRIILDHPDLTPELFGEDMGESFTHEDYFSDDDNRHGNESVGEALIRCYLGMGKYELAYLSLKKSGFYYYLTQINEKWLFKFKCYLLKMIIGKIRGHRAVLSAKMKVMRAYLRVIRELESLPKAHLYENFPGGAHYLALTKRYN